MTTRERVVIFPLFEECKNYTLDRCWMDWFANFACNKFPSGVKYDPKHHNLILKIGTKTTEVIALPEDPPQLFTVLMTILKQKLGMRSSRDLKIQKEEMEAAIKHRSADLDCDFKRIKPKHLKDQLIMNYIASLKEKYNLTRSEYNDTVSTIQLGFQFKSIVPDDVVYENGTILDIKGVHFDEQTRRFSTPAYAKLPSKPEKQSSADKFLASLHKFIKDNNLRAQKYKI